MENKNTSRVVIGVLVVLVLLLGGYIAVSGAARGGKSAATANGASEAAALPMENYQAQYVKPETPHRPQQKRHPAGLGRLYHPRKDQNDHPRVRVP